MRFVAAALIGACALVAICAGVARATDGPGSSIATAIAVTPGVQEEGTTSGFLDTCGNEFEFWTLQLKQGDHVKITWGKPAAVDTLALWPAGTDDNSHDNGGCLYASGWSSHWAPAPVMSDSNSTPSTTRLSQTVVPADGSYPLLFLNTTGANAGAFTFTAVVLHAASVSLPHRSSIAGAGTLKASVVAPDSSPIDDSTLKLTLEGYWSAAKGRPQLAHKLGTARPTNGTATFSYSLPARVWGKQIRLHISGIGSTYEPVTSQTESVSVRVPTGGPVLLSSAQLKAASRILHKPIYWAGPQTGKHYEFTRTGQGYLYVRYLPHGVQAGDTGTKFLIVATYPFPGAYAAVKKYAHGKAVAGPNGSIYYVRPDDPKSVLVAFPNVPDEIEVYDPSPAVARMIAATGLVKTVR
jgi:hypothetical protein